MSEIRATTISNAAGTGPITMTGQYAAKMWANLNGTGTIALRDSFNTSSATDYSTGYYGFNLSSSMSSANYGMSLDRASNGNSNPNYVMTGQSIYYSASAFRALTNGATGGVVDSDYVFSSLNGDLA